jgi:hypothetical protein
VSRYQQDPVVPPHVDGQRNGHAGKHDSVVQGNDS